MLNKILNKINSGSDLTVQVRKNIIGNLILKGINVLISLMYVPLTLHYLNSTRYGIWMTLTSIVAWMGILDIGLGNGLRNKLAEVLANGDKITARKYVSTAYVTLSIIVLVVLLIFILANSFIDWSYILNTSESYNQELRAVALIVFGLFGVKFVLNLISMILAANQMTALSSIYEVIGNSIGLLLIWGLTQTNNSSLITFGVATMLTPVIVYFLGTIIFFSKKYSFLKPTFKLAKVKYVKDIMGLGIQFFFLQFTTIFVYQTSNILISHFFSPAEVTPYNVVFKYFSIPTMTWTIVMIPLWSAFTKALALKDINWIKKIFLRLNSFMLITFVIIVFMALAATKLILLWTSGQVIAKPTLVIIFAIYTILYSWNVVYAIFLNGVSKIKMQLVIGVIAAVIHIPLSFFFIKFLKMGSEGIVLSMTICLLIFAIAGPIQTFKLIKKWEKEFS